MANDDKSRNAAIIVLIASTAVQVVTLMFLWKPEKFKETWAKLTTALKSDKDKAGP